jgi:hypothetical protein
LVSRYLAIVLAFGVALYRLAQGAVVPGVGLLGLGAGLICLQLAASRPRLRWLAWACFLVTAAACVAGLMTLRQAG